jgi:Arc/MetJ-type ribon-helix-helix transcriptional regulator
VATQQIAVRLPEEVLSEVDELVARGIYDSRAAAVRSGLEAVTDSERRRPIDRAVIDGYEWSRLAALCELPWIADQQTRGIGQSVPDRTTVNGHCREVRGDPADGSRRRRRRRPRRCDGFFLELGLELEGRTTVLR